MFKVFFFLFLFQVLRNVLHSHVVSRLKSLWLFRKDTVKKNHISKTQYEYVKNNKRAELSKMRKVLNVVK